MDSSITTLWHGLFPIAGCLVSYYSYFIEIPVFDVDPDQMLCSAASDLGLHWLPITLFGVSRLTWVKYKGGGMMFCHFTAISTLLGPLFVTEQFPDHYI